MVFEGINRTGAVRTNLGGAFPPAGSVCGDVLHAFVFVNEPSAPESVSSQCATACRGCGARVHDSGCNAGAKEWKLCV